MKLPDGYTPGVGVVKSTGFGGFGERMLKTFGWKEGKGLGKEEQGMSNAIEIQKKDDQIGVGFGPDRNWGAWWENAYEEAAKGVRVATVGGRGCAEDSSGSSSSDDSSGDSSSDDESDGGRGMNKSERMSVNRDGTVATGSVDELRLLASLAKAGGRVAAGRFGGRDAKMERIRRQEEMEAQRMREKLGLVEAVPKAVGDMAAGDPKEGKKEKKEKSKGKEKGKGKGKNESKENKKRRKGTEEDGTKGKEKGQEATKRQRIVIECGDRDAGIDGSRLETVSRLEPTPNSGWWGCRLFRSAGAMDSSPVKKVEKDGAAGFSEDQQAKIYETAQLTKTSGKIGLGKGKRGTIKIEGAVWKGTKVTFDDDGEGQGGDGKGDDVDECKDPQGSKRGTAEKKVNIKWTKVVKRAFKAAKKKETKKKKKKTKEKKKGSKGDQAAQIRLKALHKEVRSHMVAEYQGAAVDDAEVEKCMRDLFALSTCGKYISLKM